MNDTMISTKTAFFKNNPTIAPPCFTTPEIVLASTWSISSSSTAGTSTSCSCSHSRNPAAESTSARW